MTWGEKDLRGKEKIYIPDGEFCVLLCQIFFCNLQNKLKINIWHSEKILFFWLRLLPLTPFRNMTESLFARGAQPLTEEFPGVDAEVNESCCDTDSDIDQRTVVKRTIGGPSPLRTVVPARKRSTFPHAC